MTMSVKICCIDAYALYVCQSSFSHSEDILLTISATSTRTMFNFIWVLDLVCHFYNFDQVWINNYPASRVSDLPTDKIHLFANLLKMQSCWLFVGLWWLH